MASEFRTVFRDKDGNFYVENNGLRYKAPHVISGLVMVGESLEIQVQWAIGPSIGVYLPGSGWDNWMRY